MLVVFFQPVSQRGVEGGTTREVAVIDHRSIYAGPLGALEAESGSVVTDDQLQIQSAGASRYRINERLQIGAAAGNQYRSAERRLLCPSKELHRLVTGLDAADSPGSFTCGIETLDRAIRIVGRNCHDHADTTIESPAHLVGFDPAV